MENFTRKVIKTIDVDGNLPHSFNRKEMDGFTIYLVRDIALNIIYILSIPLELIKNIGGKVDDILIGKFEDMWNKKRINKIIFVKIIKKCD